MSLNSKLSKNQVYLHTLHWLTEYIVVFCSKNILPVYFYDIYMDNTDSSFFERFVFDSKINLVSFTMAVLFVVLLFSLAIFYAGSGV